MEYASEELRNDKEVVLEAVKKYGDALQFASEELRNDKEVVLEAVKENGNAIKYASPELQEDEDVKKTKALSVVCDWGDFEVDYHFLGDKKFVSDLTEAMKTYLKEYTLNHSEEDPSKIHSFVEKKIREFEKDYEEAKKQFEVYQQKLIEEEKQRAETNKMIDNFDLK